MQPATEIPEDIKEIAGLLGKLQHRSGDEFMLRYYADMRNDTAVKGGIEKLRNMVETIEATEALEATKAAEATARAAAASTRQNSGEA